MIKSIIFLLLHTGEEDGGHDNEAEDEQDGDDDDQDVDPVRDGRGQR